MACTRIGIVNVKTVATATSGTRIRVSFPSQYGTVAMLSIAEARDLAACLLSAADRVVATMPPSSLERELEELLAEGD